MEGNIPSASSPTPENPQENLPPIETLDAAKVALQWTMERLRKLEEANAELKNGMAANQAAREEEDRKLSSMRKTLEERTKHLEEEALFYNKLGGTLKLMCDGKLDVGALVQKQLELETIQKRLSEEHQKRLLDLEKTQHDVSDRWHQRLLELESTYSHRLNRARESFESLRQKQEEQDKLYSLDKDKWFQDKEKQLQEEQHRMEESLRKRGLELEDAFAKRKMELESECQALQTKLVQEIAQERETIRRQERERLEIIQKSLEAEKERWKQEAQNKETESGRLAAEKRKLEETFSLFKSEHHKQTQAKIAEYETQYKNRLEEAERKSKALEERSNALEAAYIARHNALEAQYEKLSRETQEASVLREEKYLRMERELRSDFEKEKVLLTSELSAALDASQKLTQQMRELQERALQETFRKDAAWSKIVEEIKNELMTAQEKHLRESQEMQKTIENLQKELMERDSSWAGKAASMENEFEAQIRFHQETYRKKNSELDMEISKQKEGMQKEYKAMRLQLQEQFESQKHTLEQQYGDRIRFLEKTSQDAQAQYNQEMGRKEEELSRLRRENEDLINRITDMQASMHQEILGKIQDHQAGYQERLLQLEERERTLVSQAREREKAFAEEREKLYVDMEKRRRELDALEKTLLKRMTDLESVKQEQEREWHAREEVLRQRDREWNVHRQSLEASYAQKSGQIEQLKQELINEIGSYRQKQVNGGIGHG